MEASINVGFIPRVIVQSQGYCEHLREAVMVKSFSGQPNGPCLELIRNLEDYLYFVDYCPVKPGYIFTIKSSTFKSSAACFCVNSRVGRNN